MTESTPEYRAERRVRGLLAERGIERQEVAGWLGISRNALGRRLSGDVAFRRGELDLIARRLGLTLEELLGTDLDLRLTVADLLHVELDNGAAPRRSR